MAATKLMIMALCLSVMISASVSQRYYGYRGPIHDPHGRLTQYCPLYTKEKIDEGYRCNSNVLDKVYNVDKDIHKDEYMKQVFRWARNGMLCYAEGPHVIGVRGACDAMELACRHYAPKVIDNCWRVVPANPRTRPPVTARPNPPVTPRGRGI